MRLFLVMLSSVLGVGLAESAPEMQRFLPSREIVLDLTPHEDVPVDSIELWVSQDSGRSWSQVDNLHREGMTVRYRVGEDGEHFLYPILRNAAGASAPAPGPGTAPTVVVHVDTQPPLLQLHDAEVDTTDPEAPVVLLMATLVEENLSPEGLRAFYRNLASDNWVDGGPMCLSESSMAWTVPADAGVVVDLRVVATDRAGNRSASELSGISIPWPTESEPAAEDADASDDHPLLGGMEPVAPVEIEPIAPTTSRQTREERDQNLEHLRTLAGRFMSEGRWALAAARYRDALELSPDDADLLVDLGSAEYRLGRYDDATGRFRAALDALPNHIGALEGLALVAATQKRYPQAREHLQHLLELVPDSGANWLRYGDIQHRLGNTPRALDAWQRVLRLNGDADLQNKAQRRIEFFGHKSDAPAKPKPEEDRSKWQPGKLSPTRSRPSS